MSMTATTSRNATPAQVALPADPSLITRVIKRAVDITGSLAGLLVFAPLLLGCGVWIYLMDGRPIFYHQWRVGRDGWLYRILKLRTMGNDAERHGARFAQSDDPRVLPGCRWMRRSHVDELPQLLNILAGQMSLVGPRPERPEMLSALAEQVPEVELRLAGQPGLTGLAQLRNGYTNDVDGARRKLAYDLEYLRKRSVVGDIKLILEAIMESMEALGVTNFQAKAERVIAA